MRTADGDVVGSFHAPLFPACCDALRRSLRVLNVDKSCDTLALATALFEDDSAAQLLPGSPVTLPAGRGRNAVFLFLMEHVSDGQFLTANPSDAALRSKVWGETPVRSALVRWGLVCVLTSV